MSWLFFEDRITEARIEALVTTLKRSGVRPQIVIDSPGGEFTFFSTRARGLQQRRITMLAGTVGSAANVLYLLGCRRLAFRQSTFWFHEVLTAVEGRVITICDFERYSQFREQMAAEQREMLEQWEHQARTAQDWVASFLADASGTRKPFILDLMRQEVVLSAQDALRYGIVHEIVPDDFLQVS